MAGKTEIKHMENNTERVKGCIVIGGSAGSLKIILDVLPRIAPDLSLPIIIVLHRKETGNTSLEALLATRTNLPVKEAGDKEPVRPGVIYLAPANYHLLVEKDMTLSLDASEKVNFSRPSIDVTFQTASEVFRKNLLAILLSGANADGTEGLASIIRNKGKTAVQDPQTAQIAFMPAHAIDNLPVSSIVKDTELAGLINNFSSRNH